MYFVIYLMKYEGPLLALCCIFHLLFWDPTPPFASNNKYFMERNLCHYSSNKSSVLQINTICFAKKLDFQTNANWFANTKLLSERKCRGMDKYVLCVTTVRLICLFMTKMWLDFLTNACRQIFFTCVQTDFLTNAIQQQMALLVNLRKTPV